MQSKSELKGKPGGMTKIRGQVSRASQKDPGTNVGQEEDVARARLK